jgi:peptidoglycan/xylan/chitin deacetylase (PgdA/CDA1 family)
MSKQERPFASLSLDLDNEWSYLKTHGDPAWETLPSYLDIVVPRVLRFLESRNLKITFFVVGQDADREENREALRSITAHGHNIGNHSYHHEPWLHLYSREEIVAELARAEDLLEEVTGQRPVGFRGPGYSISKTLLEVLADRGYEYDASSLPTFIGPLARLYYFMTARLDEKQKNERKILFGTWKDALRPLKPYVWSTDTSLVEIPVTTMPLLRSPIHFSYVIYLSRFSVKLAKAYFRLSLWLCRMTGTMPSLLLHPLDFMGREDVSTLSFFPGMDLSVAEKMDRMGYLVDTVQSEFRVVTMEEHARLAKQQTLPAIDTQTVALERTA